MAPEKSIQVQNFTGMPVFELGIMKCLGFTYLFIRLLLYPLLNPENLKRELREICVAFGSIFARFRPFRPCLEDYCNDKDRTTGPKGSDSGVAGKSSVQSLVTSDFHGK